MNFESSVVNFESNHVSFESNHVGFESNHVSFEPHHVTVCHIDYKVACRRVLLIVRDAITLPFE